MRPLRPTMIALALLALATPALAAGGSTPPSHDPFYKPPHSLRSDRPGTILRWRRVTLSPSNQLAATTVYQLLYRTTSATGAPIATVTTLLLPSVPASGRRVLLSYQTAEDSLTTNCAPSYTMRGGNNGGSTQWAESQEITDGLAHGWDVVVPDYQGPRSEWAVGALEGRTTLDSIRAVERFAPAQLEGARTRVAMIGYSGGSIPTLWANALARRYAPEVHLVGAASGGNVPNPIENLGYRQRRPVRRHDHRRLCGLQPGLPAAPPEPDPERQGPRAGGRRTARTPAAVPAR